MTQPPRTYHRPIPDPEGGVHRLAGGWVRFTRFEVLQRGAPPRIVTEAPDRVMAALTTPRPALMGLSMDRPRLMGIVNATPDSFSDGGAYDPEAQGAALIAAGADLLDVGGESTRPGAAEITRATEIARLRPTLAALAGRVPLSVDTRKAAVAEAALRMGAGMVNDVSGFDFDPDLPTVVARHAVPVCLMHARGLPQTMQDDPIYDDVVLDVYDALEARVARAEAAGIARDRIVVDPGIGFGKTGAHNLAILRRISVFHGLGCPILLGVSRKGFIGTIGGGAPAGARMPGTLALTLAAIAQGVQVHRVHDVAGIAQGIRLWQSVTDSERAER